MNWLQKISDKSLLGTEEALLLEQAVAIREQAYAPYSQFLVGAAVLLENGTIVLGTNQENAVYPNGLCAERVALFSARSLYPEHKIESIAITCRSLNKKTTGPVTCCGACRQTILEYELRQNHSIGLLFYGEEGEVWKVNSVKPLLPLFFDGSSL